MNTQSKLLFYLISISNHFELISIISYKSTLLVNVSLFECSAHLLIRFEVVDVFSRTAVLLERQHIFFV
jgi:hypothetical protein